jgi:FkbM family methyltransferase
MNDDVPSQVPFVGTRYPRFDEEYFEWIDLLEAVAAANGRFTMVELGAGWGRWLINAAAAARQCGVTEFSLVGVEAEPTHFHWMQQHFHDNDVDPEVHTLINAAVSPAGGSVRFHVGDPSAWYGQAIDMNQPHVERPTRLRKVRSLLELRQNSTELPIVEEPTDRRIVEVPAITLSAILGELEFVDLADLDIQGAEADVLESAEELLSSKVNRVHIGTHSEENEARLRALFGRLGWEKLNDYASGAEVETPWGAIEFQDGVQTWRNPVPLPHVI